MDDDSVLNAVIAACVLGIAVVISLIVFSDSSSGFTELYLLDYEKVPVDGAVSFTWGVTNHEGFSANYSVGVYVDDVNTDVLVFELPDNESFIDEHDAYINGSGKVSLRLIGRSEEVHFWTEG